MLGAKTLQKAILHHQMKKALENPAVVVPLRIETPHHPSPEQTIRDMLPCNLD